jgi:hypothetical protein
MNKSHGAIQKKAEQREGTVTIEEMGQVTEEADTTEQVENGSN